MSSQIPLPFGKFDRFNFDLYRPGPNRQVVDYLLNVLGSGEGAYIYLWGEEGTGKSHLLQAACTLSASAGNKVIYIPLRQKSEIAPPLLQGVESLDLVCVDDVDQIAGEPEWEVALFNLYNHLIADARQLIVSARSSPAGLAIRLPDLKSRLGAGTTWHLAGLDERDRLQALQQRARTRGFELPDEVIDYLSRRVARDMHSLFTWLDRMDEATLASKKKLSVPFVRDLLNSPR
ncbi:MAG: DnaA regulatory inactivator Hda [Gammaproteobacteria bacterium]